MVWRIRFRPEAERGAAVVTVMLTVAMGMLVFVGMLNVLLFLYARGVVRAAVDEGARAGSFANTSEAECLGRAQDALDDLLGGPLGQGISVQCNAVGNEMIATANATLSSPIPGIAPWTFVTEARAVNEPPPP